MKRESLLTLRIWVAQFLTDLQWPWPSAQRRFASWLAALEEARDEEARAAGVDGADLAAALVGSLRFQSARCCASVVGLIGQAEVVQARVARLLRPPPAGVPPHDSPRILIGALLVLALGLAMGLGVACGERVIGPLLALSS